MKPGREPRPVTAGLMHGEEKEGGLWCGGLDVLTFGLQLLLLLSPPRVVVIFRQLFGHGLEAGCRESRTRFKRPCASQIKSPQSHLQLPGQCNPAEVWGLGIVAFSRVICLRGERERDP